MATERLERRLTAILAADVAGYSRLTSMDEEGTHLQLKEHLRVLVDPKISEYRGHVVKNTGDGMLAEFSSVVDAVRCAIDVQRGMAQRNASLPQERRIEFRIGINVGDVIIDGGDIFGDGVNVAVRLEGIAEPGGICVSARVQEYVRGQFEIPFEDVGEQRLKNIARPVRAYAVRIGTRASLAPKSGMPAVPSAPRLSMVVLPFANLSSDPGQDYFVDGITEDLTTELSRLAGSFVIAHSTAFAFKGKSVDVKRVARELGVRYVVEGNVRRAGQRVRVGIQLINAETGAHLWADRFDREISELFELQDAITIELAHALDVQLIEAESRRSERSTDPDAGDLVMRARARLYHGVSRASLVAAIQYYREALQLAPDDVSALAELADVLASNIASLWSEAPHEEFREAKALAVRALELDPSDAYCHHVVGVVLSLSGRFQEAIDEFEAAIRLNPNLHFAHSGLGFAKTLSGLGEEALQHFAHFIRLSPRDPFLFRGYYGIGLVQFLLGDDVRAIEMLHKATGLSPHYSLAHLCLAAAHGIQGRVDEASAALANYLRTSPSARTISAIQLLRPSKNPSYLAQCERLYEGLRKAGMPER
ncbi:MULTISPECIES: tetratricopeptide repeat protein [unclassified Bradyrhizobium]|uniref:adenylate/guanylate cyclase domain-containing protein n=1 Tax=unclassified Bradyrhizobium TaxID=2631580 RepID=UPI00247A542A|nr:MULTISPECIES: tetratricopeptide repeat protein [unclassified Bradyrhizobium]WGR71814.1 adenylate/guanylate cyclase domain-containing protein [Bradyrhizobium sp. ISRA426]WGR76649.1 adenylate/guanylate cyclase domain-containing protein [Bradyrhizobium sp. ISRA430]WGR87054.1 adenylate/guanylate cyclase domain-containing protein [Bradyrhizobium sp. ISRA432]